MAGGGKGKRRRCKLEEEDWGRWWSWGRRGDARRPFIGELRRLGFAGTLRRPATGLMAVGLTWFCAGVNARRAGEATARRAALCFVNGAREGEVT